MKGDTLLDTAKKMGTSSAIKKSETESQIYGC